MSGWFSMIKKIIISHKYTRYSPASPLWCVQKASTGGSCSLPYSQHISEIKMYLQRQEVQIRILIA